jgi:parallel beta-helix repeat protein
MLGTVTVPTGATLVIPAGTRMQFYVPESYLAVKGTLQIQGTSGNMAVLTSGKYPKVRGDWQGIRIESPSTGSTIDYAVIEYGNRNIELLNANAFIRDCTIRNHEEAGIYATGATSATEIRRNYIENYSKIRTGIWLIASSPIINGNRIHRNDVGIRISGNSTPQITGNIVSDNANGINLVGDGTNSATSNPRPVLTGNDLFGNTNYQLQVYNYGSASPIVVNATGNWWGTPTPQAGTQIKFTLGSPTSTANFSSPAAAPLNGTAIAGLSLTFDIFSPNADSVQDTTTLTATLTQSASWTTTLRNSANGAVRTYTGIGTAISVAWDGKNGSSVVQPDGNYAFEVTVPGSPSPQVVGYRLTQIDNTFPTLAISTPASGATLINSTDVNVVGNATDLNFLSYTLEYGAGAAPTSWTAIATGTAAVVSTALGTWVTTTIDGSIALNGLQTLRLRGTDVAGNAGSLSQPVTLNNIIATTITQNTAQIRPLLGEQLTVNFTLSAPATAYLRIYPDLGGAMLREVSQVFTSGGAKSLSWDGRDAASAYVPDEAYRYVVFITDGTRSSTYDPPDTISVGSNSGTVDPAFNANVNDFLKMNNTLSDAKARVSMEITGCVAAPHYPYNWVPFVQGTHPLMWDGRDAAGNLVSGSCSILIDVPDPLRPFSVIVKGTGTVITGTRPSPNLEVGAEPNIVVHSYDQIGRFTYRLSLDSTVTVKLLPPGITSFTDPSAITLVNSVAQPAQSGGQPADYTIEWKGHDAVDTNNIQVSAEGTYTIAIQAVTTLTGRTTLYRGALQLYQ